MEWTNGKERTIFRDLLSYWLSSKSYFIDSIFRINNEFINNELIKIDC